MLANLTGAVLVRYAAELRSLAVDGGYFILSGFAPEDLAVILRSRPTRPAPRHAWQGLLMILPVPRHVEHGRATVRNPCWERICPEPLHWAHTSGALPAAAPEPRHVSQASSRGIWIVVSVPVKDSSNEISRS